ncbi:N-terminal acetyltransferase B complex subunit MDM20 [Cytospora mali]|uniref:N-terminal acetyltransferase B complex subunit MDM20 n=1 Tax=Cytospora mali TaxID=578113 RepID=A0A194VSP3_CYTMA|nr:N-terminal acetyltransferase B complex subunit MDM20 [Valsa mali]
MPPARMSSNACGLVYWHGISSTPNRSLQRWTRGSRARMTASTCSGALRSHTYFRPQCPERMDVMFGKLARMQLEKAANVSASATNGKSQTGRGLCEEEEINLFYRVGGKDAFVKSMSAESDPVGVLEQYKQGRKHLLRESLEAFEKVEDWDNIYSLCLQALSKEDEDGKPSFLAFDMRMWKLFVKAASLKADVEAAFTEAQEVLQKFVSVQATAAPMYKKNIGLAILELTFKSPPSLLPPTLDAGRPSYRVIQLYLFIQQNLLQRSTFDDIKEYMAELTFDEAKSFIENFSKITSGKDSDEQKQIVARVLEIKTRYFLTTCPYTQEYVAVTAEAEEPQLKCKFCSATAPRTCHSCLEGITSMALTAYQDLDKTPGNLKGLDKDPRVDLALVAATALLKLSGLRQRPSPAKLSPLNNVDVSRLLQAIVVLGSQISKTPNEIPIRLLLVQLYRLLGCASLAYQTWAPMEVKRTIQDSLSPLFFDRISSISPGLFQQGRSPLTEPLRSYYAGCLRNQSPVKIWDAFTAGSYTSILDMAEYSDQLRRSCTLIMTVVEERRATRANGGRLEGGIEQSPLLDDTSFVNAIDHGSFPNLESSYTAPLYDIIKFGPELSSERCRLALLSEQFLDAVTYKAPKDYKPTKANEAAAKDKAYLVETYSRLNETIATLLLNPSSTASKLTGPEHRYYTTINFLSGLLRTALETSKSDPVPTSSLSTTTTGIQACLDALRDDFASTPPQISPLPAGDVFYSLANPHTLSVFRDTALAIKHSTSFIISFNNEQQERDRSGKSNLHKEVLSAAKGLDDVATKALLEIKGRVEELKEALGLGGWLDRMAGWTFKEGGGLSKLIGEVVGEAEVEEWGSTVVESWREGVKGLGMVKME